VERAETQRLLGDADAAERDAVGALALAERLANPWLGARALSVRGRVAAGRRRWTEAERLHHEALAAILDGGYRLGLPGVLEALAEVAAGLESEQEAARILGAASRIRAELRVVPWRHRRAELDALAEHLRGALGDEPFARLHGEGAARPVDESIAWLRRARGERKRPSAGWESLTPTELEVVRHAAAGLSNPEIGARMFISRSTVKVHLAHVYAKLGLRNRAELAREASRRPDVGVAGDAVAAEL
jgi:DNA-binding CsgD family transcriptional regulator